MTGAKGAEPAAGAGRFRPYPAYKDSGVEWLGEVPLHWEPLPLGRLGQFSASGIDKKSVEGEITVAMVNYTDVYSNLAKTLDASQEYMETTCPSWKALEHSLAGGDILFTPSSETKAEVGFSAVVMEDMPRTVYSYHLIRLRPARDGRLHLEFSKYLCNNRYVLSQFSVACKGTTRQILTREDFRTIIVLLPPVPEQRVIADFLDRETARIDALVEKKERLIQLLQEQRTALIACAVTKGLDPTAHMRDSGVEWLGEIPKHWEVRKTTWLFSIGSGTTPQSEEPEYYGGDIPWVTTSELRESVVVASEKSVTEAALRDYSSLKRHPAGSVVIAMYGATIGRLGFLGINATVNQACCVFSKPRQVAMQYWFYWLQMRRPYLISLGYGGGQPNLSQDLLKSIRVPTPPLAEQHAIAGFLDRETARVDALLVKVRDAIERLKELRTALVSAAVTGKVDVREAS